VFLDRTVLDFVKFVELTLKLDEIFALSRVSIYHAFLEMLKRVDHLQEVAVPQEVLKVVALTLLDNGLHGDKQGILVKVVLQFRGLIRLQFVERLALADHTRHFRGNIVSNKRGAR